jgi:peptidoglycan/xylan/chitin deacetylase (PgdA/CDA1 family)
VSDVGRNAWTIGRSAFQRQIDWLMQRCEFVSLTEVQRRLEGDGPDRPCASITFDDGYAENHDFAVPLLARHGIPLTYFVSSRHVLEGEPFPHDLHAGQPVPPATLEQLRAMARQGVEVGAHTRTHADLGEVTDPKVLHDEIVVCKRELETALDRPVRYFAFPYGLPQNMSAAAFRLAKATGYDGVCSAYGAYNFAGQDAFHIRRIHADSETIRFRNWMTFDPRKVRASRREDMLARISQVGWDKLAEPDAGPTPVDQGTHARGDCAVVLSASEGPPPSLAQAGTD